MIVKVPLPVGLAKKAIDHVPGVYTLMQIPSASIDYFVHPTFYDTTNARPTSARAASPCRRCADYLPTLVDFMKAHPEVSSEAMV